MPIPIITLTTDFGNNNHLVGAMKGVIMTINPDARVIDITHNIPPFDILQAAYVIEAAAQYFPPPTIHVVVVDPGVGSIRKPLLAVGEQHYYVLPDNGLVSRVLKSDNIRQVYEVTEDHYSLKTKCQTFHGRDLFVPIGAWLSKYFDASLFGELIENYVTLDLPKPAIIQERVVKCQVLFYDRFGNIITNFERSVFEQAFKQFKAKSVKIRVGDAVISGLSTHFGEVPNVNDAVSYFGSMELLEIGVREGNAEKILNIKVGDPVYVKFE